MNKQLSTLLEKILHACTQCGKCKEECLFLKEFDLEPKELAEKLFKEERLDDVSLVYSCNLCGICKEVCPEDIDLSILFLLLREEKIKKEKEPFPALEWVKERQDWINKGAFLYSKCDKRERKCESAFFPGCTLAGYNPHLVLETYAYLRKHNPSTGIILNCCGAPFEGLGGKDDFRSALQTIRSQMEEIGAFHIITACPTCYRIFRDHFSQYKLSTVYEIMEREGLPEIEGNSEEQFFLFHPCATRHEKGIQRAVHNLIEIVGYRVLENESPEAEIRCCGMGGMVGLTNPVWASIIGNERTDSL